MKLRVCYFTHRGNVRRKNEDALLIHDRVLQEEFMDSVECMQVEGDFFLFAVADGLGGHKGGELASRMVLQKLLDLKPKDEEELFIALRNAREELEVFARENTTYYNLGTAIAGILLKEDKDLVFNVGDCRVYGIEEGKAQRLTQDHTEAEKLLRSGLISPEEAKHHIRRNLLTSAIIGSPEYKNFEVFVDKVDKYSIYLLCSDGLWEPLEEYELALEPQQIARLALQKGGGDNISFIHIEKGGA